MTRKHLTQPRRMIPAAELMTGKHLSQLGRATPAVEPS
jgi:hypothetical protein